MTRDIPVDGAPNGASCLRWFNAARGSTSFRTFWTPELCLRKSCGDSRTIRRQLFLPLTTIRIPGCFPRGGGRLCGAQRSRKPPTPRRTSKCRSFTGLPFSRPAILRVHLSSTRYRSLVLLLRVRYPVSGIASPVPADSLGCSIPESRCDALSGRWPPPSSSGP